MHGGMLRDLTKYEERRSWAGCWSQLLGPSCWGSVPSHLCNASLQRTVAQRRLGGSPAITMIPETAIHRITCGGPLQSSVILLHGYAAEGAVHSADGAAFVGDYTEVVMPDAPSHGRRADGRLAMIAALPDAARPVAIHAIAREWLAELPALAMQCRERGAKRVGLVGISMGGFAALAALAHPTAFDAIAAVLAAPTLVDAAAIQPGCPPLLLGLAGRDCAVPPDPGRRFAREYGAELHEYPESEHFMRAEDWCYLWAHITAFMQRHVS